MHAYNKDRLLIAAAQVTRALPMNFIRFYFKDNTMYCAVQSRDSLPHSLSSLKMKTTIENPATCNVWSMLRFLNPKNVRLVEIHRQIDEGAIKEGNVRKRCRVFKESKRVLPF